MTNVLSLLCPSNHSSSQPLLPKDAIAASSNARKRSSPAEWVSEFVSRNRLQPVFYTTALENTAKEVLDLPLSRISFIDQIHLFLLRIEATFAQLRRRGRPMDVCSLSNGVCIGLLGLSFLLLLCGLAFLSLLSTALTGYNQLFVAICICYKSAIADVFGVGVCPVRAAFLTVGVAVRAVRVQTGSVAAHDLAV